MSNQKRTKPRGATSATPAQVRDHQSNRRRFCNLSAPEVLCDPVMPASWTPEGNRERYQQWMQRKGVAA